MDRRFATGLVVCLAFVFLYYGVVLPRLRPPAPPVPVPADGGPVGPTPSVDREGVQPAQEEEPREFNFERPHLFAHLTSVGAALTTLSLRQQEGDAETVPLWTAAAGPHLVLVDPRDGAPLDTAVWRSEPTESGCRFTYVSRAGWTITKTFTFDDGYGFRLEIRWSNPAGAPPATIAHALRFGGIERDGPYYYDRYLGGFHVGEDEAIRLVAHSQVKKEARTESVPSLRWVGLKNRYFATVLACEGGAEWATQAKFETTEFEPADKNGDAEHSIRVTLSGAEMTLEPDRSFTASFLGFALPIRRNLLLEAGGPTRHFENLLDYSWFDFIGLTILSLLNFWDGAVGSYGIAIVLTTVTIRLCLLPLSIKSQKSMLEMQKVQPELQRLKARYGDDQRKMWEEQQRLFKEHKINPMMGCLPMFLQLPIFVGIYSVLDKSIDLRRSGFLWIHDLTQPDRLVPFGRTVKVLMEFDALNVLPLVMMVTWFYQSMTAPKPADPQMQLQQKMMMFMPILFGFLCYNLAAGLSLYFFINALWSIVEQKTIRRRFQARPAT